MFPERLARARIDRSRAEIRHSLEMIAAGNPLGAETDPERRRERLAAKENLTPSQARAVAETIVQRAESIRREGPAPEAARAPRPEAVWGDTTDFVDVAFLARGVRAARSVGRVTNARTGRGRGSGVLIGAGLFLTNAHVIESPGMAREHIVEFDYERDEAGVRRPETRFAIDERVFVLDPVEGLDFAIFGLGARIGGREDLGAFGASPLSDAADKHMIGEFANIVQHPRGRLKEVVLRENRLVSRFDDFLHYIADTDEGSSGSPVYNGEWRMIALHHWGGPAGAMADPRVPGSSEVNEGIRISSIVRHLRREMDGYGAATRARLAEALAGGGRGPRESSPADAPAPAAGPTVRLDADGTATWTVPLEISMRLPMAAPPREDGAAAPPAAPAVTRPAPEAGGAYADRRGYLPHFLPGLEVPLPRLGAEAEADAAPLLSPEPGASPFELKYHHFSVVMSRSRRLARLTACMIDGATAKSIGRRSRLVTDLSAGDPGLAEALASLDAAEADSWRIDPRIDRAHQSGGELYRGQVVPGHPDPRSAGRIARMFQKGHLVRRIDPAWGDEARALAAEMDTFHWTNAAPQVGFFNQGTADPGLPGTGGGALWRAAENFVLRGAVAEDARALSFTGPVFADSDRAFRDTRVPRRFFKVVAWAEAGRARALALLVDQGPVIEAWPESLGEVPLSGAEAWQDPEELERVADFLTTVEEVERLTGLDFGAMVRGGDLRAGAGTAPAGGRPEDVLRDAAAGVPGPDDLTRISGIGEAIARDLVAAGIRSFSQIAGWDAAAAREMGERIGHPGRAERDDWAGQARALMAGAG